MTRSKIGDSVAFNVSRKTYFYSKISYPSDLSKNDEGRTKPFSNPRLKTKSKNQKIPPNTKTSFAEHALEKRDRLTSWEELSP